jgi:curli production assembly/transport component CsgG
MYIRKYLSALPFLALFLSGCGAFFNQPYQPQDARVGELTATSQILRNLPPPSDNVIVGVYNFKDQTGQLKAVENGSSFSTAVPQGATTMLIKALEDSKWFTPIERENLANLLNERNIIRSTRDEYRKKSNSSEPSLPPLLYAGVLLEGGIVSYDTNIITGGAGARYFGAGGSSQYRQDRISIYLRAVSTSSGKILKTVYISKTILSQSVDASLFRYVSFQRLLEAEMGFTKNEPVQLALKDAIEKAVEALIIEGIDAGLWTSAGGELEDKILIAAYKADKEEEEATLLYDREQNISTRKDGSIRKNSFNFGLSAPLLNGDLDNKTYGFGGYFGYSRALKHNLDLNMNLGQLNMKSGKAYEEQFMYAQVDLELDLLPQDNFSPFVYGGGGVLLATKAPENSDADKVFTPKLQLGAGLNLRMSNSLDVRVFGESNFTFSDELDAATSGKRNDYYYNLGLGFKLKF